MGDGGVGLILMASHCVGGRGGGGENSAKSPAGLGYANSALAQGADRGCLMARLPHCQPV
jgi:hypothetical protein